MAPEYDSEPSPEGTISWGDLPIVYDPATVLEIFRMLEAGANDSARFVHRDCASDSSTPPTRSRVEWWID